MLGSPPLFQLPFNDRCLSKSQAEQRPYNFIHLPWKQLAVVNFVSHEACNFCFRVLKCLAGRQCLAWWRSAWRAAYFVSYCSIIRKHNVYIYIWYMPFCIVYIQDIPPEILWGVCPHPLITKSSGRFCGKKVCTEPLKALNLTKLTSNSSDKKPSKTLEIIYEIRPLLYYSTLHLLYNIFFSRWS